MIDNRASSPQQGSFHQLIALQSTNQINSKTILEPLQIHLNAKCKDMNSAYRVELVELNDPRDFWESIKGKKITELIIRYPSRNLFADTSPVAEDLKIVEHYNGRALVNGIENFEEGLKLPEDDDRLNKVVDSANQGQSQIIAKSNGVIMYSSREKPLKKGYSINKEDFNNLSPEKQSLSDKLFEIFRM